MSTAEDREREEAAREGRQAFAGIRWKDSPYYTGDFYEKRDAAAASTPEPVISDKDSDTSGEFLSKYTDEVRLGTSGEESQDSGTSEFAADSPRYKTGFFSPDGSGRPDEGTGRVAFRSRGFDDRPSERPPRYRSLRGEVTLARDRPAVRPTDQGSVGQSRPNFKSTGRSFLGGYSRSQRTGSGVSGNTGFSSASSSNPNQNWGGYRSTNIVSSSPLSGLGVINRPATVNLNRSEVAERQTEDSFQPDESLGVGDNDLGSDKNINELENFSPGLELDQDSPLSAVNESIRDYLVDSLGRPLQTVEAREERSSQGVDQFGQALDPSDSDDLDQSTPLPSPPTPDEFLDEYVPPSQPYDVPSNDPRDDFLPPASGSGWLGVMVDWYNPETGQHHSTSAGDTPKEGTGWVQNTSPTYDGKGNMITPRKYPKPGDPDI